MYFQMFERLVFRFKYVNVSVSEHVSCHIIQRFLFKFRRNTVSSISMSFAFCFQLSHSSVIWNIQHYCLRNVFFVSGKMQRTSSLPRTRRGSEYEQ